MLFEVHFEGQDVTFFLFSWQSSYVKHLWWSFWHKIRPGSEKVQKNFISKFRIFSVFLIFWDCSYLRPLLTLRHEIFTLDPSTFPPFEGRYCNFWSPFSATYKVTIRYFVHHPAKGPIHIGLKMPFSWSILRVLECFFCCFLDRSAM